MTFGARVTANHHGVDARQRTVSALSCPDLPVQSVLADHHGVDARHRAVLGPDLRVLTNGTGTLVPDLQSVLANHRVHDLQYVRANHRGVDARHRNGVRIRILS